jgi:hypothetical protein
MAIDWKSRLDAARAAKEKAEASITAEDRAEQEARAEEAKLLAEAKAAEHAKRDLDLARRMDLAREKLGPKAKIRDLAIKDSPHTFVLAHQGAVGARAYVEWEKGIAASASPNSKVDRSEVNRKYALVAIYDWNGVTEFGGDSGKGHELVELLKNEPGIVSLIVNAGTDLAGLASEERKS